MCEYYCFLYQLHYWRRMVLQLERCILLEDLQVRLLPSWACTMIVNNGVREKGEGKEYTLAFLRIEITVQGCFYHHLGMVLSRADLYSSIAIVEQFLRKKKFECISR
mmetsp:Transcript_7851/g.11006  ORF Transcript_7851/g.11006 Transcript_7851/m.11006 type:complete len:107 (-) Transcript_7851:384-704(-)